MAKHQELTKGQIGHTYIKRDYGRYTLYKCDTDGKYRKVMHSEDYEEIRPHRHEHRKKWTYTPPPPYTTEQCRDWQRKLLGSPLTGGRYGKKPKRVKKPKVEKVAKRAKTPKPKKEIKTQTATLAASDKALGKIPRTTGLVIAEQSRPQKVEVKLDSKTSVMVYPHRVENAIARYNQRYRQSQEQNHLNNRAKPKAEKKIKQEQSENYFYN
jgi:hypothetical protein